METTPIEIFSNWFEEERNVTKVSIPTACCLSTIGTDNYPNARFVSLKEIQNKNFIITGTLTSRKGIEINENNRIALTFWWIETERQVRIQGNATRIINEHADKYFAERNRDSQIVSIAINQELVLNDMESQNKKYQKIEENFSDQLLKRPENWGVIQLHQSGLNF